jgi:hypothetical protein
MDNNQAEKEPKIISKSFMALGPTLHYSHKNVHTFWLLTVAAFALSCLFWSKIVTGSFLSFNLGDLTSRHFWYLGHFATEGVSIFEYPWQIAVLGLLMGILAIAPLLVSQLLSFIYSTPFILAVFFLANLPGLAISQLISCIAVACRPLRFRSRFVAVVLCTAPQLLYWGYFGGVRGLEPLEFGFSFAPWICAWFVGLAVAGLVLGIGHFTRYRPGLIWISTSVVLLVSVSLFQAEISFAELDYQLYVAKNNPEQIQEFHDHSITDALDRTLTNPAVKKYLAGFFYPTEPIPLRSELKREIQNQLRDDRWPSWFIVPPELNYQAKKQWLLEQYDLFINLRPRHRRTPIALYYKALLSEYKPDIRMLDEKEILHFYNDYPDKMSQGIWYLLYGEFGDSAESLEARWRYAMLLAGKGQFDRADKLLAEAQTRLAYYMKGFADQQTQDEKFFSQFRPSADSAMTAFKLTELQAKLVGLRTLIGPENGSDKTEHAKKRLARFVMLNPHASDYEKHLDELLEQIGNNDPLRDNILLAQAKLIPDEQLRAEKLNQIHTEFQNTDGGRLALYELALLKIQQWRQTDGVSPEQKKELLADARETLTNLVSLYPDSFCAEQAKKNLEHLPTVD